jgi:alpha-amylase
MTAITNAASGEVIYFEKPDNWKDTIYIYYWEGSPTPSSLYDYEMTHVSGNIYSYTCKTSFSKFLIDDGSSGKHQTVDIDFPGDGYIVKVLSTGSNNGYGNYCNDAVCSKYEGVSDTVSVSASPKGCDFLSSIDVTLSVTKAEKGYYKINGGNPVQYTNGTKITLGADAEVGDKITLNLSAGEGAEAVSETYVYTKTSTPSASSLVYFDNSSYNWDDVYIYTYGTAENAEWPGVKMQKDDKGMYYYALSSKFSNENIIFNNGKEDDEKEQFPENSGLPIKKGECKLLTADNEWVDYGTPDSKPAGFAYTASGTSFSGDTINVKIGLKNAVKGTYQIDGGTVFEYTDTTTVSVGQGAIANKEITLTLTATSSAGEVTTNNYKYKKTFSPTKTTFASPSDGHTSSAVGGKYGTNPNMQLGNNKTITVDGNPSDWNSSMIIAQGVANDDPRVYMPSAMHEQPWDDYALYAAWDNDNLYFMWEMANTTYVVSPSDNFAASQEARPWRNSIPIYLALSVNPSIHADGTAWGTDPKSGAEFTNPFVWGCTGGTAKDGGVKFTTNVDTLIAFDTNNSNGGASIFKADKYDKDTDNYMFNYDTAIPIGVTSFEKQDNRNGFKIAHDYGTLSDSMIGVGGAKGSHKTGDSFSDSSNWVDFFDLGYKKEHGFIYEVAVPLSNLGIDKNYIEQNGIGAMQILTYGTSGMDCLPYDASMQDTADVPYSYDPSTSHEKEDVDTITVPLARIGALLPDTVVNEAPFEVNFGTEKAGTQGVGSNNSLKAVPYNGEPGYNFSFKINGKEVQNSSSDTYSWTPTEKATYDISVTVKDKNGKTATAASKITVGDEPVVVTQPTTVETQPITESENPTSQGGDPTSPSTAADTISGDDNPTTASVDNPTTASVDNPTTPSGDNPTTSSGDNPTTPGGDNPTSPIVDNPTDPYETVTPTSDVQPGTDASTDPFATDPTGGNIEPTGITDPNETQTPTDFTYNTGDPTTPPETTPSGEVNPPSPVINPTEGNSNPSAQTDPSEPSAPAIKLNKTSLSLKAGQTFKLTVNSQGVKAQFKSSKTKTASVNFSGVVTALKKGSSDIIVTVSGKTLTCKVKVTSNPTAKIKKKAVKSSKVYKIEKGKKLTVKITGKAKAINNVYKSSKKKIAKVISKKKATTVKIKGYKKGKATITLKINKVKKIKIKVKVV